MKEIMDILNDNGYESFIVGGYVRDYLLGIPSFDVDICTNAPIEKLIKIFKKRGKAFKEYYSYHIEEGEYSYDITTYRKELKYKRNKPVELEVAKTLGEDLLRRDFTINTFAIDRDGRLIDLLGAKKDLDRRIISVVGNVEKKLTEDKTRLLRAIRFFCTMDFDLDIYILKFLNEHKHYLNDIPKEYVKKELDKIFDTNGYDKFFYIVESYGLKKYLHIDWEDKVVGAYDKYGIWAQLDTDLPFTNEEKKKLMYIKKLVSKKDINFLEFNTYSDDVIYNAAFILGIQNKLKYLGDIKTLHSSVINMDASLSTFLDNVDLKDLKKSFKLVERSIMEGTLNNNEKDIIDFLKGL